MNAFRAALMKQIAGVRRIRAVAVAEGIVTAFRDNEGQVVADTGTGKEGGSEWRARAIAARAVRGPGVPGICAIAMAGSLSIASAMPAQAERAWPGGPMGRVQALAVLQSLNADLLSHDSATLTLDRWCAAHRIDSPATIVAERRHEILKPATAEIRAQLKVSADTPIGYRHVWLRCGNHVLSEADNWYVPSRLTADMNRALDTSDIAFGRAVQSLHFSRHTLSADILWSPLPAGWDMQPALPQNGPETLAIPHHVLEHRALLSTPEGSPISLVVEDYTAEVLGFSPPA
jgi:hypothetical protein